MNKLKNIYVYAHETSTGTVAADYVGITYANTLRERILQHARDDRFPHLRRCDIYVLNLDELDDAVYEVFQTTCPIKHDMERLESYYISLLGTSYRNGGCNKKQLNGSPIAHEWEAALKKHNLKDYVDKKYTYLDIESLRKKPHVEQEMIDAYKFKRTYELTHNNKLITDKEFVEWYNHCRKYA